MDSNPDRFRTGLTAVGALALAAALFYYGTGERPLWWASWCAVLVLLSIAPRLPGFAAFGVAALASFLGSLNMLPYTRNVLVLPRVTFMPHDWLVSFAIFAFMVVPAIVLGIAVVLFRYCVRLGALWQGALVFALTWTSYEYLSSVVSPHGTFGNLAYTQMENLLLVQLASLTGIWGISFCVCLVPAAVAALAAGGGSPSQRRALVAGTFVFFAAVAGFGAWHLQTSSGPSVEVGLIASDLPANADISNPGKDTQHKLQAYIDQAKMLAARGAKIVVLPEKLGVTVPATAKADDAILQSFADRTGTMVMVGLVRSSPPDLFNEARLYEPARSRPLTYDKQHMLPQFESQLTPGTGRALIRERSGIWGVAVCKDMDFPQLARAYGDDDVGLLLVSAWDFDDDNWLHARMAVMRGVESGFTIARAARSGLLTVSDSRGRILAHRSSKAAPFSVLLAAAPVRHEATLYDRFGDWFAWLCLAGLMTILASLFVGKRRDR